MTTIYLDNCSLQRPYDDQAQVRIRLETEAILAVITLFEQQQVELVASETLYFEAERTPVPRRKKYILQLLEEASNYIVTSPPIVRRAKQIEASGVKPFDALHLATAMEAGADYFCTCDDKFLKRAKRAETGKTQVVSPLELIEALEQ